jgi:hypothetical protein
MQTNERLLNDVLSKRLIAAEKISEPASPGSVRSIKLGKSQGPSLRKISAIPNGNWSFRHR